MKDNSSKHHYIIILTSLALCLFLYIDTYFVPVKSSIQKVQDMGEYYHGRSKSIPYYTMIIKGKEYDIPYYVFNAITVNDEVKLEKSVITGSLQRVGVFREDEIWLYEVGYLRVRFGKLAVPIIILGCLLMLVFFKIIDNIQGRANLSYALFICSLLLLFAHLDLNLF